MDTSKLEQSKFKGKIKDMVNLADSLRTDGNTPMDVTFAEIVEQQLNTTVPELFTDMGINPMFDTIHNISTVSDLDVRWIIPEFIRNAIRLGYRQAPIWPNIIAAEEQMKGLTQVMPHINMSDATPAVVNEGETIPLGDVSYGSKKFNVFKIGKGIQLTDEVIHYSSLNVVSLFMQDFGIQMGQATDTLAIDTLINGEQLDGSQAAPIIGVAAAGTKTYKDLLKIWIRLSRMGRTANTIVGGEDAALETMFLDEFRKRNCGTTDRNMNFRNMVEPNNVGYYVHGNVPTNHEILLDPKKAMLKFNARPLMIEAEKIVSNQTQAFYATTTLGFAKLFQDASLILDKSVAFASNGFPTYMDVDAQQNLNFEGK